MKAIDSALQCPSCQAALAPKVLGCDACNLRVEGPFELNEFALLPQEDLHFLRIFIRCEGRIRDMEPALGLSYPTIRTRLSQLKNKLVGEAEARRQRQNENEESVTQDALKQLEEGKISFDEAMKRIKKARPDSTGGGKA